MLTVGSLFSGIGGLDLGLERAGMRVKWQCEADPYCRAVLRKHWPDVPCFPDVRGIPWGPGPSKVDVLAGGFPCQPVSRAGKRLRMDDQRWLWPEFARLIRLLGPRYVLVENVPGLLDGGIGDVLGDLADLGFDAEWSIVSACAVGAPHLRDRVFIVAYASRDDESHTGPHRRWAPLAHEPGGSGSGAWTRAAWLPEPPVGRVADGLPSWMVRGPLAALGNSVVPQVVEHIGRLIIDHAQEEAAA